MSYYHADEILLAYRADISKTRAAMRLEDALVAHGRSLGDIV